MPISDSRAREKGRDKGWIGRERGIERKGERVRKIERRER
jgi:hypothetical protein